jgi:glycosyltransferase involved in cell wall biosynthesis
MRQLRTVRSPMYQLAYLLEFWPTVIRLAWLLRREHADLVHTNSMFCLYGAFAARLAGVRHVWQIHEIPDQPAPLVRLLAALTTALADRVVVITAAVGAIYPPVSRTSGKVVEVLEGIDVTRFHPANDGCRIKADLIFADDAPLVGWAARLDPWKGCDVFIRAAARVHAVRPDVRFLVCGGELPGYETYAAGLHTLARDLGLDGVLHFSGWHYTWTDMPEVMAALDVLVHTPVRPEPLGLVVLEAMATARPVVVAAEGGILEVITDGVDGVLVPAGNVDATAAAIRTVLDDVPAARRMAVSARHTVETRHDADAYAARIQDLFVDLTAVAGGEK